MCMCVKALKLVLIKQGRRAVVTLVFAHRTPGVFVPRVKAKLVFSSDHVPQEKCFFRAMVVLAPKEIASLSTSSVVTCLLR